MKMSNYRISPIFGILTDPEDIAEFDHKPTRDELERENLFTTATKVFCSAQCHGDYNHDLQETRYMNLKQKGKIHNNG